MASISSGNTLNDGSNYHGWIVGNFISSEDGLRKTDTVEVKWGIHKSGETKQGWTKTIKGSSLTILIKGRFLLRFPDRNIYLSREGDYAIWEPGIYHNWSAIEDSVVLTIKWPSLRSDIIEADANAKVEIEEQRARINTDIL